MLNYASEMLDGVKVATGGGVRALSMEKAI